MGSHELQAPDLLQQLGALMVNKLALIRVLFRAPDTLCLYGIPYDMREGQQPSDLWQARSYADLLASARGFYGRRIHAPGPLDDWIWLGCPGWWGNMSRDDQAAVKAWLQGRAVPENPFEWCCVSVA